MAKKTEAAKPVRFMKLAEVKRLTTFSTTEVYRRIGKGQFPRQIKIGAKSVVWVEQEVMAWIDLMIGGRFDDDSTAAHPAAIHE